MHWRRTSSSEMLLDARNDLLQAQGLTEKCRSEARVIEWIAGQKNDGYFFQFFICVDARGDFPAIHVREKVVEEDEVRLEVPSVRKGQCPLVDHPHLVGTGRFETQLQEPREADLV